MNRLFKQMSFLVLLAGVVGTPAFAGPDVQALHQQESYGMNQASDRSETGSCKVTKAEHLYSKGLQGLSTVNCRQPAVTSCKKQDPKGYQPIGQTKGYPMGRPQYC